MVKDTAIARSAPLASWHAFRPAGPAAAIVTIATPISASAVNGSSSHTPMAISGASNVFTTIVPTRSQIRFAGSRICWTLKVMPRLAISVISITTRLALKIPLKSSTAVNRVARACRRS